MKPKFWVFALLTGGMLATTACSGGEDRSVDQGRKEEDSQERKGSFSAPLKEMDKQEYPDNPNWGYMAREFGQLAYDSLRFTRKEGFHFDLEMLPSGDSSFPIILKDIDLSIYTPQAPEPIQDDDYLTYIGLINQEWNRQQVRFSPDRFEVQGGSSIADSITRVDVARNCLNAGLWELIAYKREDGEERPVYHGWFDFPVTLYSEMFEEMNGLSYEDFRKPLEEWVEPKNQKVELEELRNVKKEWKLEFQNRNEELYPLREARKKKYKNIIRPEEPGSIQEMLTDSTLYATFDQPGFYNTDNPRETQLGKLARPQEIILRRTSSAAIDELHYEIELRFLHNDKEERTRLVVGGLDLSSIPRLKDGKMNQGFKMPMGIANHSFYENYEEAKKNPVTSNPYFGMLIDGDGKWLDSHLVGIDGPLMYWDAEEENVLHFLILSFERHAFVGHYELEFPQEVQKHGSA